jgi:hypothetical protein
LRFHRLFPVGEVGTRSCCNRQRHRHRHPYTGFASGTYRAIVIELAPHEQVSATGSLRSSRHTVATTGAILFRGTHPHFITILLVLAVIDAHVTYLLYLHLMPPRHHTRSHEPPKTGPATPATKQSHRIQIAIYCSENSNLPAPHYRIITTRPTKKSDRRELKSQSQTDWGALVAHRAQRVSIAVSIG